MSIYQSDPAAPGANVGRHRPQIQGRLEQAIGYFNGSTASQTVTGLMRTLGLPRASVGAAAGSPSEVRITVAWELCWYQWGVDLGDGPHAVFEVDKGSEVDQLERSARQWNARLDKAGQLVLAASRRPSRVPRRSWLRRW